MPTASLKVTPEQLEAEANKIASNTPLFDNNWRNVYKEVDSLSSAGWWRGEAHDGFRKQIDAFKRDFESLSLLLTDDFKRVLANSGTKYKATESALVTEAGNLPESVVR